jgi:hypothetical protein
VLGKERKIQEERGKCGEPAISLHSHHVSLVQWTTCLLPVTRDPGSNPQGETGILLLALSHYKYSYVRVRVELPYGRRGLPKVVGNGWINTCTCRSYLSCWGRPGVSPLWVHVWAATKPYQAAACSENMAQLAWDKCPADVSFHVCTCFRWHNPSM